MAHASDAFVRFMGEGLSRAKDAVGKAAELVASGGLDGLLGPQASALQQSIATHVGAKLSSAAVSGLTSATVAVGAAGLVYVAVSS